MNENEQLRLERLALLIGTVIGQISDLLNQMKTENVDLKEAYECLLDIHTAASLHIHELYYKGNKKESE